MTRRKNGTFDILWGLLVGFPIAIGLWLGYKITHSAIASTMIAVVWAGIGIVILLMMKFSPKRKQRHSSNSRMNTAVHQTAAAVKSKQRTAVGGRDKEFRDSAVSADERVPQKTIGPTRIGDIGEYKLDVQLRQMSNDHRYLNDVMIPYSRSRTGYSQIDHILITQYGIFVIEMKNYSGTIKGMLIEIGGLTEGTACTILFTKTARISEPYRPFWGIIAALSLCPLSYLQSDVSCT